MGYGFGIVSAPPTIERIDSYVLRVPLQRPLADSIYHRTHWHVPVVEITTSEGLVGTGYSGLWTGEDLLVQAIETEVAPQLIGRDPREIHRLWSEVYWSPVHWVGRAGIAHMAQGMVDIALWDLAAQRAGMPLWQLLGGRYRTLGTYNTDGGWLNFTQQELLDDICDIVARGWDKVKMKVGGADLAEDIRRVTRVREAIGDDVTLMVDVNQRWDLITARRALPALADLDIRWLEEPLHPDDVAGHAALVRDGRVPIALGENVYSLEHFAAFLRADAVDVVQADVTRVAGVSEWLRVAHLAQGLGRWVCPHAGDMCQIHQHLVAGIGADTPGMIEYLPWTHEIFVEPVDVQNGILTLPETPGASTTIRPDARERFGAVSEAVSA
jgi:L-alanine-DL-glutamate epimerase-like enolase superfamily enzyme